MSIDVNTYSAMHGIDLIVLEPRLVYDPCIVDVVVLEGGQHVAVYDWDMTVDATMADQGWDREDAAEWMEYNSGSVVFNDEENE